MEFVLVVGHHLYLQVAAESVLRGVDGVLVGVDVIFDERRVIWLPHGVIECLAEVHFGYGILCSESTAR